jgi:hypothetical protein
MKSWGVVLLTLEAFPVVAIISSYWHLRNLDQSVPMFEFRALLEQISGHTDVLNCIYIIVCSGKNKYGYTEVRPLTNVFQIYKYMWPVANIFQTDTYMWTVTNIFQIDKYIWPETCFLGKTALVWSADISCGGELFLLCEAQFAIILYVVKILHNFCSPLVVNWRPKIVNSRSERNCDFEWIYVLSIESSPQIRKLHPRSQSQSLSPE